MLLRRGVQLNGTVTVDGERSFYAARLVGGKGFVLLRPTDVVASSWRPHVRGLLIGAAAAATLAALAAFFLARAIARPVRRVSEAARTLAHDESPEPIPVEGPRELAVLAESFNESAAQLAQARAAERQFLLSVSHELKTPLTAIRGYAEGLADGVLDAGEAAETIGREALRLERLVQDLLDLARMNKSEFSVQRVPIDLAEIAREVARRYEGQAHRLRRRPRASSSTSPRRRSATPTGWCRSSRTSSRTRSASRRRAARSASSPDRARSPSRTPGPASGRKSFRTPSSASTSTRATAGSARSARASASRS